MAESSGRHAVSRASLPNRAREIVAVFAQDEKLKKVKEGRRESGRKESRKWFFGV